MRKPIYHLERQPIPKGLRIYEERLEVAGLSYRRRHASQFIKASNGLLELRRDPQNVHDANAIEVLGVWRGWLRSHRKHIGYVPRGIAARLVEGGYFEEVVPRLLMTWIAPGGGISVLFQLLGPKVDHTDYLDRPVPRGSPNYSYVDKVKSLKAQKRHDEAIQLLLKIVGEMEDQVGDESLGCGVSPWYYEQLAIIYRKERRYRDEVRILERYANQPKAPGAGPGKLDERLAKARQLLD